MKSTGIITLLTLVLIIHAQTHLQPAGSVITQNSSIKESVSIIIGAELSYDIPLKQVRRLLENEGIPYNIIKGDEAQASSSQLLIGIGSTLPEPNYDSLRQKVNDGTSIIWIGEWLPDDLYSLFGVKKVVSSRFWKPSAIKYGAEETALYNESILYAEADGSEPQGYFVDSSQAKLTPSEFIKQKPGEGTTILFAYDVCSYWGADQDTPWLRAERLKTALDTAISNQIIVRLNPFPRGYASAYITRVEDVDPIHTDPIWLSRAEDFLTQHSLRGATVTATITPYYVDEAANVNVALTDPSAKNVVDWLTLVRSRGGAIVQHGYTHQYNSGKTGITTEFYDEESGKWLPFQEQKDRILKGVKLLNEALGAQPTGFEAPHYTANNDTYTALKQLGFTYITHNADTIFFDRYTTQNDLINIPETQGYIPNNPPPGTENRIKTNLDTIHRLGGVSLLFNHLFQDEMKTLGINVLEYAITKGDILVTNTDALAYFWNQRLTAYSKMSVERASDITITLGPSKAPGLTLTIIGPEIKGVKSNGVTWPTFTSNQIILPSLTEETNVITVTRNEASRNPNILPGLTLIAASIVTSVAIYRKLKKPIPGEISLN